MLRICMLNVRTHLGNRRMESADIFSPPGHSCGREWDAKYVVNALHISELRSCVAFSLGHHAASLLQKYYFFFM